MRNDVVDRQIQWLTVIYAAPDALIVSDSPISDEELNIDAKNGIKVEVPGQDQRNGEIR